MQPSVGLSFSVTLLQACQPSRIGVTCKLRQFDLERDEHPVAFLVSKMEVGFLTALHEWLVGMSAGAILHPAVVTMPVSWLQHRPV